MEEGKLGSAFLRRNKQTNKQQEGETLGRAALRKKNHLEHCETHDAQDTNRGMPEGTHSKQREM